MLRNIQIEVTGFTEPFVIKIFRQTYTINKAKLNFQIHHDVQNIILTQTPSYHECFVIIEDDLGHQINSTLSSAMIPNYSVYINCKKLIPIKIHGEVEGLGVDEKIIILSGKNFY